MAIPRSLTFTEHLQRALDIPVFNNHQHAAAVVMFAALKNALQVVGKELQNVRVVVAGAGAAGLASAEMLLAEGAGKSSSVTAPAPSTRTAPVKCTGPSAPSPASRTPTA